MDKKSITCKDCAWGKAYKEQLYCTCTERFDRPCLIKDANTRTCLFAKPSVDKIVDDCLDMVFPPKDMSEILRKAIERLENTDLVCTKKAVAEKASVDTKKDNNNLDNPHYIEFKGQPIDIMRKLATDEMFEGFLLCNILKYGLRYGRKDEKLKEAKKIKQYADWLVEHLEKPQEQE